MRKKEIINFAVSLKMLDDHFPRVAFTDKESSCFLPIHEFIEDLFLTKKIELIKNDKNKYKIRKTYDASDISLFILFLLDKRNTKFNRLIPGKDAFNVSDMNTYTDELYSKLDKGKTDVILFFLKKQNECFFNAFKKIIDKKDLPKIKKYFQERLDNFYNGDNKICFFKNDKFTWNNIGKILHNYDSNIFSAFMFFGRKNYNYLRYGYELKYKSKNNFTFLRNNTEEFENEWNMWIYNIDILKKPELKTQVLVKPLEVIYKQKKNNINILLNGEELINSLLIENIIENKKNNQIIDVKYKDKIEYTLESKKNGYLEYDTMELHVFIKTFISRIRSIIKDIKNNESENLKQKQAILDFKNYHINKLRKKLKTGNLSFNEIKRIEILGYKVKGRKIEKVNEIENSNITDITDKAFFDTFKKLSRCIKYFDEETKEQEKEKARFRENIGKIKIFTKKRTDDDKKDDFIDERVDIVNDIINKVEKEERDNIILGISKSCFGESCKWIKILDDPPEYINTEFSNTEINNIIKCIEKDKKLTEHITGNAYKAYIIYCKFKKIKDVIKEKKDFSDKFYKFVKKTKEYYRSEEENGRN